MDSSIVQYCGGSGKGQLLIWHGQSIRTVRESVRSFSVLEISSGQTGFFLGHLPAGFSSFLIAFAALAGVMSPAERISSIWAWGPFS
jgi:hypothetical protein